MGSGVGHVEQGEGPDDQEPEGEVHGEADHPQGSYSQKAADDRSCGRKDSPKIFPELAQEARYRKDDFVLCNIPFSPGQVIYGYAQESIRWVDGLDNPEDGLKPQFRNQAKGKKRAKSTARPAVARFFSRESMGAVRASPLITASKTGSTRSTR